VNAHLQPATVGEALGPLRVEITAERVRRYAVASGDVNPLHLDPAFAATTPFKTPIAHGMLLLAYINRVLSMRFGSAWASSGDLEARFRSPAKVGATIVVEGTVQRLEQEQDQWAVYCSVSCRDAAGQPLVTAEAAVRWRAEGESAPSYRASQVRSAPEHTE
jgi:3-hydroxybutyryl-CoA dehydratase